MNPIVDHERRLREIIDDELRRRQRGESVHDEALLAAHPELSPRLAVELKRLRMIAAARAIADESPGSAERSSRSLMIRCPRCTTAVSASAETEWDQIHCPTCGNSFRLGSKGYSEFLPPRWIAHFELLRPLGEGGFGAVWEAQDTRLDRRVAIKLPRHRDLSPRETELFLREARAAAQLRHPNIVAVFEIGQAGEQCYIVSELIRGQSVSQWLSARERDNRQCVRLCGIIAQALDHAHRAGVIHRDLKPANVVVDAADQPHLLDFGLAKRESGEVTMTLDGQMLGTVAYMSPEQARGTAHQCTAASDLYSLGVMLFEMLTGELPFRGSPSMLVQQIVHDEAPSPRRFRSGVPRDLETICSKCLEKEPARRYASGAALADDLTRFLRGEAIHARPVGHGERAWRWCRRNRAVAALAAAVLLTLVLGTTVATYFAVRASISLAVATAATRQAEHDREMAQRSAYNAQLARATVMAPYLPRETLELLADQQRCPERLRDFAWHYIAALARRDQRVLSGHTRRIHAVAFSPDGTTAASASQDGTIRLWRTSDWSLQSTLTGHRGSVNALTFLPATGTLISAGDDWTVRRWDVRTGAELGVLASEVAAVQCLAASSDGRLLAWATSGLLFWGDGVLPRITLCDPMTCTIRKQLVGHTDTISALVFSPDGRQLVSGGYKHDPTIRVWDTASGACLDVLKGHETGISALAFLPDRQTLVSAGERIRFWDLPSRTPKPVFAHNPSIGINSLAVAPDGLSIAIGQWSRDVTILDAATGSRVATLAGHERGGVFALSFSRDGKHLLSAGSDPEIRVWDVVRGSHAAEELIGQSGRIVALACTRDAALLATASRDDKMATWQTATGRLRNSWTAGHGELHAVVLEPDGHKAFTAGRDGLVRVWDAGSAKLLHAWRAHEAPVRGLALSADGLTLASAGEDGGVVLWNAAQGTRQKTLAQLGRAANCVAVAADGTVASGGADGMIRLWNATSGRGLATITAHQGEVTSLAFYADGKTLASCSIDSTARIWDVPERTCRATIRPPFGPLRAIAVSCDGQTLVTAGYKLSLWDAVTGQERCAFEDPQGLAWSASFAPGGNMLISGYDNGAVRLRRASSTNAPLSSE